MGSRDESKYNFGKLTTKMTREEMKDFNNRLNNNGLKQYKIVDKLIEFYKLLDDRNYDIDYMIELVQKLPKRSKDE